MRRMSSRLLWGPHRRRRGWRIGALTAVMATAACAAPTTPQPTPIPPSPTIDRTTWDCPEPATTPLPDWASAGFATSQGTVPHFVGAQGEIVGVAFGWPLHAPRQEAGRSNKILWVARDDAGGRMTISAVERDTGRTSVVSLDGPGPSIVDMPAAGCWKLELAWTGHRDEVYVRYDAPTA